MFKVLKQISCRLVRSTLHSLQGLKFAVCVEFSFRYEVFLALGALAMAILLARKALDVVYLMTPIVVTMAFELCNTAIEKAIDDLGKGQIKESFKVIKDCASAAVFLMILWSLVTWLAYFYF